ncbi:MAG: isoamylase early set domain-containing protein [Cellvibrionaceae bacterium]|nr:isoamylase early set domain-containing protein [Cellvibrionaceae bacterium]
MSIKKKYLKSKPICKVKFIAPDPIVTGAKSICLAGDFNGWDLNVTKLRKQRDGSYATTLDLAPGAEYGYRFVIDGQRWENDYSADKYKPTGVCMEENSVVVV